MWNRKRKLAFFAAAWLSTWSAFLLGQDINAQKFDMAYQWAAGQFQKEMAQVEDTYEAEMRAAQAKRAQGVKMARVRYLQGLKFLNGNPALPQAMRVKINEEMKRIAALPEPAVPEMKAPASAAPGRTAKRTIRIKLDAPDSGWSVRILQAKKVGKELWVLSALQHGGDIATMAITPVEDAAVVEASEDLPVRHFVLNKTWDWKNKEDITFIRGVPDLGRNWALGEIAPLRRE